MDRRYDIVTFDCYGTLVDWESGIADAFLHAAREEGIELRREDVLRQYASIEPDVERERFQLYRDILTETATRVAGAVGWPITARQAAFLPASLASWKPFPDTNPALERLRAAGYELGILSNTDEDLLSATRRHFTVEFDLIVTAQQVRSYKPAHPHFLTAKQQIGDRRWLHAAQSNFHDIGPATALGIPNAWVNRHGEIGGVRPTYEVRDMAGLADLLT
jgi:2-haloalkanoic acid dehalogenase type II